MALEISPLFALAEELAAKVNRDEKLTDRVISSSKPPLFSRDSKGSADVFPSGRG